LACLFLASWAAVMQPMRTGYDGGQGRVGKPFTGACDGHKSQDALRPLAQAALPILGASNRSPPA